MSRHRGRTADTTRAQARFAVTMVVLLVLGAPGAIPAQETPPTFPGGTELVILDMVVRDEAGQLVTDLKPEEIEAYEDGAACLLQSVRLVRAGQIEASDPSVPAAPESSEAEGSPAAPYTPVAASSISSLDATAPPEPESPLRPNVVILVFGRLGMEAAGVAREAATAFVGREFPPGTWFAAYEIGDRIRVWQRITSDATALVTAIDEATAGDDRPRDRTTAGVIARLSHDWPLSGPLMEAPGVRNQSATVKRTLQLAPGEYTLETAVGDRLSGGVSVQRTVLEVAAAEPVAIR